MRRTQQHKLKLQQNSQLRELLQALMKPMLPPLQLLHLTLIPKRFQPKFLLLKLKLKLLEQSYMASKKMKKLSRWLYTILKLPMLSVSSLSNLLRSTSSSLRKLKHLQSFLIAIIIAASKLKTYLKKNS